MQSRKKKLYRNKGRNV